jgi:phage shock protein A
MLMRDLESEASARALADYKDLVDEAAGLRAALKMSQATLASEHRRIERWDETIHDLKDKIAAVKQPWSTVSTQPVAQSLHAAGPSSCPMAPLPA